MQVIEDLDTLRQTLADWRRQGQRIALVPTMGNLHAGHLDLVTHAQTLADQVVVSIFVNPTQFGPNEDLAAYPRTLAQDQQRLREHQASLLFLPDVSTLYPGGLPTQLRIEVSGLSDTLCGEFRPGHFVGVATVVAKLFIAVMPDVAVFGEKDFQQLMVIRRMSRELLLPIRIEGVPTRREADGLALSSRNQYLSAVERTQAPALYQELRALRERILAGARDYPALEQQTRERLQYLGFVPDYVSVRRAEDLQSPAPADEDLVVLAAAYLGRARLIDNVRIQLNR
jgi:pantoate--beta-alanine ligase